MAGPPVGGKTELVGINQCGIAATTTARTHHLTCSISRECTKPWYSQLPEEPSEGRTNRASPRSTDGRFSASPGTCDGECGHHLSLGYGLVISTARLVFIHHAPCSDTISPRVGAYYDTGQRGKVCMPLTLSSRALGISPVRQPRAGSMVTLCMSNWRTSTQCCSSSRYSCVCNCIPYMGGREGM